MDRNAEVIILKGFAQQILSMAMPTIQEANKLLASFGVEIANLKDAKKGKDIENKQELYDSVFIPYYDKEVYGYFMNAEAFYKEASYLQGGEEKDEALSYALHFYRLTGLNVHNTGQLSKLYFKSDSTGQYVSIKPFETKD